MLLRSADVIMTSSKILFYCTVSGLIKADNISDNNFDKYKYTSISLVRNIRQEAQLIVWVYLLSNVHYELWKTHHLCSRARYGRSRSSNIVDFGTSWKGIYLAPFLRYSDLLVENRKFSLSPSHSAPSVGVTLSYLKKDFTDPGSRVLHAVAAISSKHWGRHGERGAQAYNGGLKVSTEDYDCTQLSAPLVI